MLKVGSNEPENELNNVPRTGPPPPRTHKRRADECRDCRIGPMNSNSRYFCLDRLLYDDTISDTQKRCCSNAINTRSCAIAIGFATSAQAVPTLHGTLPQQRTLPSLAQVQQLRAINNCPRPDTARSLLRQMTTTNTLNCFPICPVLHQPKQILRITIDSYLDSPPTKHSMTESVLCNLTSRSLLSLLLRARVRNLEPC